MTKTFETHPYTESWRPEPPGPEQAFEDAERPGPGRSGRPRLPRWAPSLPSPPRWWPLALGVLLGVSGGAAHGLTATPQYAATGYVVVVPYDGTDPMTALGFAQAYGRVTSDGAVLAAASRRADMPVTRLKESVRVATSPDAPMVEITGTHERPARAAAVANAVAAALTRNGNAAVEDTGVRLKLFSKALPPAEPTSPSPQLSTAVGACAGGLAGALALLAAPRGRRGPDPSGTPAPAARTEAARTEPLFGTAAEVRGDHR